jgi:hypothetical protein
MPNRAGNSVFGAGNSPQLLCAERVKFAAKPKRFDRSNGGRSIEVSRHNIVYRTVERFKRNQVEAAIFRTLGAEDARAAELKLRLHRLLVTDRRLGRSKRGRDGGHSRYAFYSQEPPGSGVEVMFSGYEAFALLAAVMLLEHGIPQATVVSILRQVRTDLEAAHAQRLKMDPKVLFDPHAVRKMVNPGMIATDNIAPVFLAFVRISGSEVDGEVREAITVCRGHEALAAFVKKHSVPGLGATFFEFVGLMWKLADNLAQTRPVKRGRASV